MSEKEPQEGNKGPSKKELKKLAKKAEKAAAKEANKKSPAESPTAKPSSDAAPEASSSAEVSQPSKCYYIAHADSDSATLKASVASAVFNVPLRPAAPSSSSSLQFLRSPALLTTPTASPFSEVAFGGNAIAKAMGLLSEGATSTPFNPEVDEWLEYERTTLRPSLASSDGRKIEAALQRLEEKLSHGGTHLVGTSVTAADVSVAVTLYSCREVLNRCENVADSIKSFVSAHSCTEAFQTGLADVAKLLPEPPFDYDGEPSLLRATEHVFTAAIQGAFPSLDRRGEEMTKASVQRCNNSKHGDYQCNSPMQIFAKLKKSDSLPPNVNSPKDAAKLIMDEISEESNPVVQELEISGPGFILCRIKSDYLQIHMNTLIFDGIKRPSPAAAQKERCVVDFSSPNIAKEMHVGHLRSTIIGESVCRILEFGSKDVKRVNHIGDWGTQFGMLIQYLKEEYPDFDKDEGVNITDLTAFYKSAKERFDESPEFKKNAQTNVVLLQSGDKDCLKMWKILCDVSRREFQKVYDRLDVTVEECGESFYNDKIPDVIKEFEDAGMISIEEGGAKCIFVPNFKIPLMLQKSDGGFGYDSTDMAALKYRLQTIGANHIIVITDFSQGDHFKMCFSAAEKIGWVDPSKHKLQHIGFGTVQGEDGKRFKTRSGDTVRLVDLLDEAVHRMETSLKERIKEGTANITEEEVPSVAAALGYGAVKYFDLRRNPTTNYVFSYDRMLDTKGNTAIYLLYAHARLESICTKAKVEHNVDVDDLIKNRKASIVLGHPSERNLALYLQMFTDTIETTLDDLYPYHICDFLYNSSIAASEFVTQCRVLGSPEMESRLLLCRATTMVMRQCFDLLAIRHVMRI